MTPMNEPILISLGCFLVAFTAASLFITPPAVKEPEDPNKPKPVVLTVVKDPAKATKIVASSWHVVAILDYFAKDFSNGFDKKQK